MRKLYSHNGKLYELKEVQIDKLDISGLVDDGVSTPTSPTVRTARPVGRPRGSTTKKSKLYKHLDDEVSQKTAAKILDVAPCTLRKWTKEHSIPVSRMSSRTIRYVVRDLLDFKQKFRQN